jgi:hypothetical protein
MSAYTVIMKDGEKKEFPETYRTGGSYCTTMRCEIGFAVIKDAYGNETYIPTEDIKEIIKSSTEW